MQYELPGFPGIPRCDGVSPAAGIASPTVYVDDAIHPWRGRKWAHLFCEDIEVLHGFALRLGLKRSWFQSPPKASWPHYDVTDTVRFQALRLGAVAADRYATLEIGLKLQGRLTPDWVRRLDALRNRRRVEHAMV